MVLCPFHDDHHPSGGIWAASGYFKCFACHETASLAEFLAETLDLPLSEAIRLTRGQDRISELEDRIRASLHADDKTFQYFSVTSFHSVYPPLEEGFPEWDYVVGRGITPYMIRLYDMRKGVKKYRNRVVLPIYTPDGKLVSYVGRAITKNAGTKTMKSRSPHRTLFGLRELVRQFPEQRLFTIVVVEGEFDAIYLQEFGIAAVSNMGTMEMTQEKVRLLRRYAKKVVLSYDGDEAGEGAMYGDTEKGKHGQFASLSKHLPVVTVSLPEEVDPNGLTPEQVEEYYGEFKVR